MQPPGPEERLAGYGVPFGGAEGSKGVDIYRYDLASLFVQPIAKNIWDSAGRQRDMTSPCRTVKTSEAAALGFSIPRLKYMRNCGKIEKI